CLFASPGGPGGKTLIHLDGVDSEEQMKRLFSWKGEQNTYSDFERWLDQQPREADNMPFMPYDKEKWFSFTGGLNERSKKVKFAATPGPDDPMIKVVPGDFKIQIDSDTEPADYGAAVERLPKPAALKKTVE